MRYRSASWISTATNRGFCPNSAHGVLVWLGRRAIEHNRMCDPARVGSESSGANAGQSRRLGAATLESVVATGPPRDVGEAIREFATPNGSQLKTSSDDSRRDQCRHIRLRRDGAVWRGGCTTIDFNVRLLLLRARRPQQEQTLLQPRPKINLSERRLRHRRSNGGVSIRRRLRRHAVVLSASNQRRSKFTPSISRPTKSVARTSRVAVCECVARRLLR